DTGFSVSRILPSIGGVFLDATAELYRGNSSVIFQQQSRNDLTAVGHLPAHRDPTESTNIDLGFSFAPWPHAPAAAPRPYPPPANSRPLTPPAAPKTPPPPTCPFFPPPETSWFAASTEATPRSAGSPSAVRSTTPSSAVPNLSGTTARSRWACARPSVTTPP